MRIMLLMCSALLGQAMLCQEIAVPPKPFEQREAMIALIGDGRSLLEAGNSGDRELIPALRSYLAQLKPPKLGATEARMALAKLGERRAQQEIICEFFCDDKIQMQNAAETELPYIGGWSSIAVYKYLLSSEADKRFWKAKKPVSSDLALISPATMAVMQLPKVVPNPPLRPAPDFLIRGDPQHDREIWLRWIADNQVSLMLLQPTGEGIDFSGKSCKSKPREHLIH